MILSKNNTCCFHFTRYMQSIKVHQVSKYWLLLTLQKLHRLLCFSFTGICMQNMQSTVFTLFLGWELYVHM